MRSKRFLIVLLILLLTSVQFAYADDWYGQYGNYFTVYNTKDNSVLFKTAREVRQGDQYLSADNNMYKVTRVNSREQRAYAEFIEQITLPTINEDVFAQFQDALRSGEGLAMILEAQAQEQENRKVGIYCTHSSESYVPTDGTESTEGGGGILQVAERLKAGFEQNGVNATFDNTSHDPHDAGAYTRSRRTAAQLLREHQPTSLIDVHRDAIPPEEYTTEINGEPASKVRLVVGGRNQNFSANEETALQAKAVADKMYPGLIKDIFYAQGNYNQDLTPRAMLLEMGTAEQDRALPEKSATLFSEVLTTAFFGGTFTDQTDGETESARPIRDTNRGSSRGIIVTVLIVGAAALAFLFISSGGKEWKSKLGRFKEEFNNFLGRVRRKK
ncbi:stage II sporulation protein P [Serpentinicella alkaliphila]|uniref:Stage II sporulation protein P n=1 Tax=Serpentinicella alkaliphila TaxID=1734049 RepID=A0A4R2TBB1_9FIRM|nr:stage II sporulation protein P [Serpentinicella alkaliphila]QUH26083.1 stage II sporulation protein P [Serpentinicella alkaliphila]TCP99096.1 stage II sporulation protein P [Serpentinicella alkaliphila]